SAAAPRRSATGLQETTRPKAMTFREFSGKNVEEAIRAAMREYDADLSDLDIEIMAQGSRGILGVGGEEARILAAPKSAVDAAPVRPEPARPPVSDEADADAPVDEAAPAAETPQPDADAVGAPVGYGDVGPTAEAFDERSEAPARRRGGRARNG